MSISTVEALAPERVMIGRRDAVESTTSVGAARSTPTLAGAETLPARSVCVTVRSVCPAASPASSIVKAPDEPATADHVVPAPAMVTDAPASAVPLTIGCARPPAVSIDETAAAA